MAAGADISFVWGLYSLSSVMLELYFRSKGAYVNVFLQLLWCLRALVICFVAQL